MVKHLDTNILCLESLLQEGAYINNALNGEPCPFFFFKNFKFSYQTQIGNQPQEYVAKFGYKKNRGVEKLGVLLHFGDLLGPTILIL
jgi:hypothetical protein